MFDIADPRIFPELADAADEPLLALAQASLAAPSATRAEEIDDALVSALVQRLRSDDGSQLADLIVGSPSVPIARHLWRRLIVAWREASRSAEGQAMAATLFAIPLVIVAAKNSSEGGDDQAAISGVLPAPEKIADIMRHGGALGGNLTFALCDALAAADAIDIARLPALLAWQRVALDDPTVERDVPPTPMAVQAGQEGVHLRFIVGSALAAATQDVLASPDNRGWAIPMAQELARQLAVAGLSVLVLPGNAQTPLQALQSGHAAQREVGAQLFASNALRRLRAAVGEPTAIISGHRCPAAPRGGELRLSLSSVFDSARAEGFRCPLFAIDRASDVAGMLVDLLRDCRVADIRVLTGVHPDRDPATGKMLLFKPDALPTGGSTLLH